MSSGYVAQGKRVKKQGRSVIHANVAEALKMRQVSTEFSLVVLLSGMTTCITSVKWLLRNCVI